MVYFKEEQRLNQAWLWAMLMTISMTVIGGISYAFYIQLYLGESWASKPLSDNQLIIMSVIILIVLSLINWTILSGKLELEVRPRAIHYRFFPFIPSWNKIKKEEIEQYAVQKFNPFGKYGGWGYRKTKGAAGFTFTVKGDKALYLTLTNGKKLLLGTQKPQELDRAMDKLMKNHQANHG